MTSTLDLNLLPITRRNGQDQQNIEGLHMVVPPRRPARGRDSDRLILYFSMTGNAPLSEQQQTQMLERLSLIFYHTPGSITAALRKVAEHVNQLLLDRNLRSTSIGRQGIGNLVMLVMRDQQLMIAQCGQVHTFLVKPEEVIHYFDAQASGRGLGIARALSIRYYQSTLGQGDFVILSPQPPPAWSAINPKAAHGQGIESLRRRLLGQASAELSAVLIQALTGTGKMRLLRTKTPPAMAQPVQKAEAVNTPAPPLPSQEERSQEEEMQPAASSEPAAAFQETASIESDQQLAKPVETTGPEAPIQEQPQSEAEAGEGLFNEVLENEGQPADTSAEDLQEPSLFIEPDRQDDFNSIEEPAEAAGEISLPDIGGTAGLNAEMDVPGDLASGSDGGRENRKPFVTEELAIESQAAFKKPAAPAPARPVQQQKTEPGQEALWLDKRSSTIPRRKRHRAPMPKVNLAPVRGAIREIARAFGVTVVTIVEGLRTLLKRMLPDESLFSIPASTMVILAVAIGVVISVAGGAVYLQRGRAAQFQVSYDKALAAAEQARVQTDPLELRTAWETALDFLDEADSYKRNTPESQAIRIEAQQALDNLDAITRLNFQPAIIGGLGSNTKITRMAATENELFMLNGNGGNVLRAILTGQGYDIDPDFSCAPNPKIGPIIDIVALPKGNNLKASILAMDANANLMYCISNDVPTSNAPAPPQSNWVAPSGIALDGGDFYVLDPQTNAVWIYWGMDFANQPHLFFGSDIPFMADVIDLVVNQDDLYLLHSDGHITTCTYSGLATAPTRCEDPATFSDPRLGRQDGPLMLDAPFSQIQYMPPPDPSIYLLDATNQAIYHFSVRLTFQRQFRSANPTPATAATAFTISPGRRVFMAVENQVYFADMP